MLTLTEGVPRGRILQADGGHDIPCRSLFHLLPGIGVHLVDAAY